MVTHDARWQTVVTRDSRLNSTECISRLALHPYTTNPDALVPLVQGVARCEVEKIPQERVCERHTTVVPQHNPSKAQAAAMAPEVALRIIEDCHRYFKWVSSMDRITERKDIEEAAKYCELLLTSLPERSDVMIIHLIIIMLGFLLPRIRTHKQPQLSQRGN